MAETSAQVYRQAQNLVSEAAAGHLQLVAEAQQFAAGEERWRSLVATEYQRAREQLDESRRSNLDQIQQRMKANETQTLNSISLQAAELAPGALGWTWGAPQWSTVESDMQPHAVSSIRVGSLLGEVNPSANSAPALLPLLNSSGWIVGARAEDFSELIEGVLLRLLSSVPIGRLRVTIFDPTLDLHLGSLMPLREASRDVLPAVMTRPEDFEDSLHTAVADMVSITDELSNLGVSNVEEHWRVNGSLDLSYRIVVVNNYPLHVTSEVHKLLLQVARTRGTRGATMIVRRDPDQRHDPDRLRELTNELSAMEVSRSVISAAQLPRVAITNDGPPPRNLTQGVAARLVGSNSTAGMPSVPLLDLLEGVERWTDAEHDGVRARFGRIGRKPLELRLLSESPALPNALIGGATGQGKSNLLLAIIHALAIRYRPDQLRMFLLDFRQGVELSRLGPRSSDPTWLPHAEVLGLESDREFGLSVLQHLVGQFMIRSKILTSVGAKSIVEYRRRGLGDMPRLVLIIDEFQVLLDGDDEVARKSVEMLEQIARQGRGYGVHMILASQTTSGIRGLAVKGEAIFGQFPTRISLKNTNAESQAILGQGNKAAADLTYRGEVIVNEDFGNPESNRRGVVALADEVVLGPLRQELWRTCEPAPRPPVVFNGARPVEWDHDAIANLVEAERQPGRGDSRLLWVGRPVSVESEPISIPVSRDSDQAVVLAGPNEEIGAGVMSSIMLSLASTSQGADWVVVDGSSEGSGSPPPWLASAMAAGHSNGHSVRRIGRDQARQWLVNEARELLSQEVAKAPETFVFLVAPQRIPDIMQPETWVPDDPGQLPELTFPNEILARLVKEGGPRGVQVIGWWLNTRTAAAHIGFGTPGVGAHVLFDLAREELVGMIDPRQPLPQATPRIIVKDSRSGEEIRVGIPFEPLSADTVERFRDFISVEGVE